MGRCRERGTVRNSRVVTLFETKVWRERRSFRVRFASDAISAVRHLVPLQSRARRGCFREPRFWSCAGHSSQHRNRPQSHQSHVQRRTALTPAKGGRVRAQGEGRRLPPSRSGFRPQWCCPPSRECSLMALHSATMHGEQSRDTGKHGDEGMTVSAHSCRMVGALSDGDMHACMAPSLTLRSSLQRPYSCTRRTEKQG